MLLTQDIHIRDPFVLVHGEKYYLYGSRGQETWGFCTALDVYVSSDLENWEGPFTAFAPPEGFWSDYNFWAPEVHFYRGSFYMFVSFKSAERHRGTQILKSETPIGPFVPITDYPVTPEDWECLDGTLYVDKKGMPHIIFCHEWTQIGDGTVCAMPLSEDLKKPLAEPTVIFSASDVDWVKSVTERDGDFVTDGPFLWRTKEDKLVMLWSSYSGNGYTEALVSSDSGELYGSWTHEKEPVSDSNGGHGMLFSDLSGELRFVMHSPNTVGFERPCFMKAEDTGKGIKIF